MQYHISDINQIKADYSIYIFIYAQILFKKRSSHHIFDYAYIYIYIILFIIITIYNNFNVYYII